MDIGEVGSEKRQDGRRWLAAAPSTAPVGVVMVVMSNSLREEFCEDREREKERGKKKRWSFCPGPFITDAFSVPPQLLSRKEHRAVSPNCHGNRKKVTEY